MSGVATAIGASSVLGYVGSQNAANKQSGAMDAATALQKQEFEYQKEMNAPYQQAGTQALGQMQDPRFQKNFSMSDFNTSPGYQFSLKQGQNALNAMNAATGNSVSGAGMAALSNYNVGTANQEYQQAFNNYNSQLQGQYGRLSTLAAGGAGANAAMGGAAQSYANQAGNNMAGSANAQAAAGMAGMNAIGSGLSGMAGYMNRPQPMQMNGGGQMMAGGSYDNGGLSMSSLGA